MSQFQIPPYLLDPDALPPPIRTSDADSFAYNTFRVRIPAIIDDILATHAFAPELRAALQKLRLEVVAGTVRGLQEKAADTAFWNEVSAPNLGRSWLDVPWYWAESFFYRRILEATGYFQAGPWYYVDPYLNKKAQEWRPNAAPALLNAHLQQLPQDSMPRFQALLYGSLWGNRIDLSYNVAEQLGSLVGDDEQANLLVDDWPAAWLHLQATTPSRIIIIADNAGTELVMDLALIDFLLAEGLASQIDLHLKAQPFFISDTMPQDLHTALSAMTLGGDEASALAQRIRSYLEAGSLRLHTHWFYTTCLFYFQLPADLQRQLAAADLVLLKGDANYRRLLGDAHWPYTTPFAQVVAYFPAPVLALRTLKSEIVVGLAAGEPEALAAADPDWLVNGKRGVIQARLANLSGG